MDEGIQGGARARLPFSMMVGVIYNPSVYRFSENPPSHGGKMAVATRLELATPAVTGRGFEGE